MFWPLFFLIYVLTLIFSDTLLFSYSFFYQWESFSIGELHMFIKILDKEENDYIADIKRKYKQRVQDIKRAIEYQAKKSTSWEANLKIDTISFFAIDRKSVV